MADSHERTTSYKGLWVKHLQLVFPKTEDLRENVALMVRFQRTVSLITWNGFSAS